MSIEKNKIPYDVYCSQICKAKCCSVWAKGDRLATCPKLNDDNLCTIYEERYKRTPALEYSFSTIAVRENKLHVISAHCGKVEEMIARGELPKWIEKQCCFAHPELLEVDDDVT